MKKINTVLAVAACATCIASAAFALSSKPPSGEEPPSSEPLEQSLVKTVAPADAKRYTVREYEGNIAVFNEDGTVHSVYEVNVALLPEYDRGLLKSGITIIGEKELRSIVEDYTS